MLSHFKKVLVLAPHTDDGELGAGGTIHRLIGNGADVFYVAFSTAEDSLPPGYPKDTLSKEVLCATTALGIKAHNVFLHSYSVRKLNYHRQEILEELVKLKRTLSPDLVLMPSPRDLHQDHSTVSQEGLRAFKTTTILAYELIWNNLDFNTTAFVRLEEANIDAKFMALTHYESQSDRKYMQKDFIKSLAHVRGVQVGCEFAECFEVIRWMI